METHNNGEVSPSKKPRMEREGNDNNAVNSNDSDAWNCKIFNDSVHGHIEVNEACLAIIDTPQFQRLRFIKQLGFCYYVYPGATSNRFEHSIGVYHLAGKMVRSLKSHQPDLKIEDKDILCVEIAGLCHDLGHGPHSHMFDGKFIPLVTGNDDWKHEEASLKMLDYLIEDNKLMEPGGALRRNRLNKTDIIFIKELINGPLGDKDTDWPYLGRGKEKAFLYEIISNKLTGIDVDKWDYFARDCHHLGIVNNFDHNRFIKFVRVLDVNGRLRICSRDKEIGNLYQMFYTRYILHRSAYQHKVACACEIMAVDALVKANDHLKISNSDGSELTMSECINDMTVYMNLTDNILWDIYTSQNPKLLPAKKIMQRLFCRDLYRCLDERHVSQTLQAELSSSKNDMMSRLRDQMIELSQQRLDGTRFRLQIVYMDFGKKDKDPLQEMHYYSKSDIKTPKKGTMTGLLVPPRFTDNLIRVYSIDNSPDVCKVIKESFKMLCDVWHIEHSQASLGWEEPRGTPEKKPYSLNPQYTAGSLRASQSQDY